MLEEKHFDQQLLGAERELREKQSRAKNEQKVYEATKAHARASEKQQRENVAVAKKRFIREMDSALVEANIELSQKKRLENEAKKTAMVRLGVLSLILARQGAVRVGAAPAGRRQPVAPELVACKELRGCGQRLLAVAAPAQGGERVARSP